MENMAKIINATPNSSIQIPSTKYKIRKLIQPHIKSELHIKCNDCLNYTSTSTNEIECSFCHKPLKTTGSCYFAYIPVEQQLKQSVQRNIDDILAYDLTMQNGKEHEIADIHHSILYKNAQKKHPFSIILPIIINTDGIKVFRSGNKSLWLIQIYQCYLKPTIRFKPSNVIVVAAHFGFKKPNMKEFFYPFLKEMREIYDMNGFSISHNGKNIEFLPLILGACCDLPAKSELLGMIAHNGHFSCSYCMHPGILIKTTDDKKSVVRYTKGTDNYAIRSHQNVIETYRNLKSSMNGINGIKSISSMIAANEFDLVNGFAIDPMHCVYLGVLKKLISLWLDTKNHKQPYYLKKQYQVILSNRLVKLKPISDIIRRPRSIFSRADFKANEFRGLLLYFLTFALTGLLDIKYIRHFRLLSSSVYTLSKECVSISEISDASFKLNEFVNNFEILYGVSNVTVNIHLLRHLAKSIENLGPLWVQTAFGFEANNGIIAKANTCTNNILCQLKWKYCVKKSNDDNEKIEQFSINGKKVIKIDSRTCELFSKTGFQQVKRFLTIYKNVIVCGRKFTSIQTKEISTIDYFVQLKNGLFGVVNYYVIFDDVLYALINLYDILDRFDHFIEINFTTNQILVKMIDIRNKMIYLKFGRREFVTALVNKFEKS